MMTKERISSVLVDGDGQIGILLVGMSREAGRDRTGVRDARRRPDVAPLISVPAETSAGQVLTLMYERGIMHVGHG